jgi:hypothetical protein
MQGKHPYSIPACRAPPCQRAPGMPIGMAVCLAVCFAGVVEETGKERDSNCDDVAERWLLQALEATRWQDV